MTHALSNFIREEMLRRDLRNVDVEKASGLSRQLVSKLVTDQRETLTRLPERATLEGIALAFRVPLEFILAKAVESLGLGFTAGDFVSSVQTASDRELLGELERRLRSRADEADKLGAHLAYVDGDLDEYYDVAADPDRRLGRTDGSAAAARSGSPQDSITGEPQRRAGEEDQDPGGIEPV